MSCRTKSIAGAWRRALPARGFPGCLLDRERPLGRVLGLHHPVFDDVWLCRPWNEIDLARHREEIDEILVGDTWLVSGLDLEVRWLSEGRPARALIPPTSALAKVTKPDFKAAERLPIRTPPAIPISEGERAIHRFCRRHNWNVWVKGPAYEARRARNWRDVQQAIEDLSDTWSPDGLFVQSGIEGWEVSVVFAALEGRLLGAASMEKRQVTEEGKTWAAATADVESTFLGALREVISDLNWTGGGELEFVRDPSGGLWLIDWNPRFPAWIHGLTLAGTNLPALLLASASGVEPRRSTKRTSNQFIRVVVEIPVRGGLTLPPPPSVRPRRIDGGKHPSGMPLLMRRCAPVDRKCVSRPCEPLPPALIRDLRDAALCPVPTPFRAFLPRTADAQFSRVAALSGFLSGEGLSFRVAYSTKTNPSLALLALARDQGFLAEVISAEESAVCARVGYSPRELIFNGPVPAADVLPANSSLRAIFADSTEAYARAARLLLAPTVGIRLRPPFVESRFGVNTEDPHAFAELADAIREAPDAVMFGASLHVQSSEIGIGRWADTVRSVVQFVAALQELTGRQAVMMDLGGGFASEDIEMVLSDVLADLLPEIRRALPGVRECFIEPGKALAEPCAAIVATVLEVRRDRVASNQTVVIDASVAEIPFVRAFPHRIAAWSAGVLTPLHAGSDRILGRLCIESDILAKSVALPLTIGVGDRIVIADAGAYDASMSYDFACGSVRPLIRDGTPSVANSAASSEAVYAK